jgi:hypothetical protein
MRKVQAAEGLRAYERTLALEWPVEYFHKPDEGTCRCTCDERAQRHEVWFPTRVIRDAHGALDEILHELCHCKLAEEVDVAFSTIYFVEKYSNLAEPALGEFTQKAHMLYYAWAHVDIWVNDLRNEHWPEIAEQDHRQTADQLTALARTGQLAEAAQRDTTIFLGVAIQIAEEQRHGLEPVDYAPIFESLGESRSDDVRALAAFYASLPRLAFEREQDVKLLEASVREVARAMQFPVQPRIMVEKNRHVWDLEPKGTEMCGCGFDFTPNEAGASEDECPCCVEERMFGEGN